jgi:serine phosphatase RsbU (regulator of sigma subunit)
MNALEQSVRERLLLRRGQLADLARTRREEQLIELVQRVDAALESLDDGNWGRCQVCHEQLSEVRLHEDPLLSVCIECLSPQQRSALERDLESAAQVQRSLLPPRRTEHAGWEFAYLWEPFGSVSGDHVDLLLPRGEAEPLHLLLGDVAGKGLPASLLQAHLHALFRAISPSALSLGEVLDRANRLFFEATSANSYATVAAMRLHGDGRIELANAGHPRPLLADRRGVRPIEDASLPLGMFEDSRYEQRELRLAVGDTLLLYTDGLTEAARGDDDYGVGRAAAALRREWQAPLPELLRACREDLQSFLLDGERHDDLTVVALRRIGG